MLALWLTCLQMVLDLGLSREQSECDAASGGGHDVLFPLHRALIDHWATWPAITFLVGVVLSTCISWRRETKARALFLAEEEERVAQKASAKLAAEEEEEEAWAGGSKALASGSGKQQHLDAAGSSSGSRHAGGAAGVRIRKGTRPRLQQPLPDNAAGAIVAAVSDVPPAGSSPECAARPGPEDDEMVAQLQEQGEHTGHSMQQQQQHWIDGVHCDPLYAAVQQHALLSLAVQLPSAQTGVSSSSSSKSTACTLMSGGLPSTLLQLLEEQSALAADMAVLTATASSAPLLSSAAMALEAVPHAVHTALLEACRQHCLPISQVILQSLGPRNYACVGSVLVVTCCCYYY